MNAKKFLVSGVVGGIVNYLLGWLLYGIIFMDQFPVKEGEVMNLTMIALGSLVWGLFVAYIFTKWARISTWSTGLQAGAIIGFFLALYYNIFYNSIKAIADVNWQIIGLDVVLTIVITAISGAAIAIVIDKMK
jgi:hypothetical protein